MPVPYLAGAVKGWTRKTQVKIITQTVVDHEVVPVELDGKYNINLQPSPPATVNRKPEEQRTWKWWSIILRDKKVLLKTDDKMISPSGKVFKIQSATDWRPSGFSKYEAIEDYEVST